MLVVSKLEQSAIVKGDENVTSDSLETIALLCDSCTAAKTACCKK